MVVAVVVAVDEEAIKVVVVVVADLLQTLHARFHFIVEGCVDDEALNSHGGLPHCSPSDSILEMDLLGERVFISPPLELVDQIGQQFETCRRTAPTSTMAIFLLPKWAKFNLFPKYSTLY
jgi:hypothetical protein